MSFDLLNVLGEEMTFSNSRWAYLIEFARAHGSKWPKRADGEDADTLSSEQARQLADAITSGMRDGSDAEIAVRVSRELTGLLVIPSDSPNFRRDPIVLTSRSIEHWRHFVDYARRGGFSINF